LRSPCCSAQPLLHRRVRKIARARLPTAAVLDLEDCRQPTKNKTAARQQARRRAIAESPRSAATFGSTTRRPGRYTRVTSMPSCTTRLSTASCCQRSRMVDHHRRRPTAGSPPAERQKRRRAWLHPGYWCLIESCPRHRRRPRDPASQRARIETARLRSTRLHARSGHRWTRTTSESAEELPLRPFGNWFNLPPRASPPRRLARPPGRPVL